MEMQLVYRRVNQNVIRMQQNVLWISLISWFLINLVQIKCDEIKLYQTKDGYRINNELRPWNNDIQLEDFFWTGSGDGPPAYLRKPISPGYGNQDVSIKTATVVATVYVDGENGFDEDALCTDIEHCQITPEVHNLMLRDRRYWLLTVLAGFYPQPEIPELSEKLAKLYRLAFTRQQSWHLGIENNSSGITLNRRKRDESSIVAQRLLNKRHVGVLIHNVSLYEEGNSIADYLDSDRNPIVRNDVNRTEIIYSVLVNAKPVVAVTAAADMKWVSMPEVIELMGREVYTKAEPYLKEPQATPLVPPSGPSTSILAMVVENPVMFGIGVAIIFLLVLILVAILLMTKTKRKSNTEDKRLVTVQTQHRGGEESLSSSNKSSFRLDRDFTDGIDNLAYEKETARSHKGVLLKKKNLPATITFPGPPRERPPTSPSSSATSDSSVYYLNKDREDIESICRKQEEKRLRKGQSDLDETEAIYATISKSKMKKSKKRTNLHKCLGENKVGSVESVGTSQQSLRFDGSYQNVENNRYQPKVMHPTRRRNSDEQYDVDSITEYPTEAYNKSVRTPLRKKSSGDSGSIGSFLSMASIRSFPKYPMPEALNRVLEPTSVTHFDYSDGNEGFDSNRQTKVRACVHQPSDSKLLRSQSDGADPGVVGPVVWDIHKRLMDVNGDSPMRDPVKTRFRFEGLLESAIEMYSTKPSRNNTVESDEDDDNHGTQIDMPGVIRPKENRGKSAIVTRNSGSLSVLCQGTGATRPFTAGTANAFAKGGVTQPPSPSRRAWASGAPSPLVRPLSAGPLHRPEPPVIDAIRILASQQAAGPSESTLPIIEAIQDELKKFDRNE